LFPYSSRGVDCLLVVPGLGPGPGLELELHFDGCTGISDLPS
jgi:hypothetical protein